MRTLYSELRADIPRKFVILNISVSAGAGDGRSRGWEGRGRERHGGRAPDNIYI